MSSFESSKRIVKTIMRNMGVDIRLVRNIRAAQKREWEEIWAENYRMLNNYKIGTVIDIGAHTGQFAKMIRRVCPLASIYSFEPLRDCYEELEKNLAQIPEVYTYNFALGDSSGAVEINRCDFSPSSSLLDMTERHKTEWPHSALHTKETIQIRKLDDVLIAENLRPEILVKVDVQGYEAKVIAGAERVLSRASVVIVEVSFAELYSGQPLFDDIYTLMQRLGYRYAGNAEQYSSRVDGQILFADAVFLRMRGENQRD